MSYLGILQDVSIFKISPSKYNLREANNVEELAESIKHYGLLQPIVIRPVSPSYEVVAGNRRLAAAKLLKLRKLSCHVIELSDKEAYEVGLVENLQHKTMNPVEESIAFKKYVEGYGYTTPARACRPRPAMPPALARSSNAGSTAARSGRST